MLIDQNYNRDNICKIMGHKQVLYRFSNLRKMHWKLVLGHLFYPKNRTYNYAYLFLES